MSTGDCNSCNDGEHVDATLSQYDGPHWDSFVPNYNDNAHDNNNMNDNCYNYQNSYYDTSNIALKSSQW